MIGIWPDRLVRNPSRSGGHGGSILKNAKRSYKMPMIVEVCFAPIRISYLSIWPGVFESGAWGVLDSCWSVDKSRDWQPMHHNRIRQIQSDNFEQHKLVGSWSNGRFRRDQQKEMYDEETSCTSDLPRAPNNRGSPLCSKLRICRETEISASAKLIVSYMKINPH